MRTQGKQNKRVPILLIEEVVSALEKLVKYRGECGIKEENPFLFPNTELNALDSWQVLQNVARAAGCKNPSLISSNKLRKYLATVCQVSCFLFKIIHKIFCHLLCQIHNDLC